MKQLLSGIAMAALIAAGVPALAQTTDNSSPQDTNAQSGATNPSPTGKQGHAKKHAHRSHKSSTRANASGSSRENNMADELNRQELQRVTAGSGSSNMSTDTGGTMAPEGNPGGTGSPAGNMPSSGQSPSGAPAPTGAPSGTEMK